MVGKRTGLTVEDIQNDASWPLRRFLNAEPCKRDADGQNSKKNQDIWPFLSGRYPFSRPRKVLAPAYLQVP